MSMAAGRAKALLSQARATGWYDPGQDDPSSRRSSCPAPRMDSYGLRFQGEAYRPYGCPGPQGNQRGSGGDACGRAGTGAWRSALDAAGRATGTLGCGQPRPGVGWGIWPKLRPVRGYPSDLYRKLSLERLADSYGKKNPARGGALVSGAWHPSRLIRVRRWSRSGLFDPARRRRTRSALRSGT